VSVRCVIKAPDYDTSSPRPQSVALRESSGRPASRCGWLGEAVGALWGVRPRRRLQTGSDGQTILGLELQPRIEAHVVKAPMEGVQAQERDREQDLGGVDRFCASVARSAVSKARLPPVLGRRRQTAPARLVPRPCGPLVIAQWPLPPQAVRCLHVVARQIAS
jgi:hypothetical protein